MAYPSFLPFLKWNRVWRSFGLLVTIINYRSLPKTILYDLSIMFRPSTSAKVIHNLACVSIMEKHFHILRAKFILCTLTLSDDTLLPCFLLRFQSYYLLQQFELSITPLRCTLLSPLTMLISVDVHRYKSAHLRKKTFFGPNWSILQASLFWPLKFEHWSHPLVSYDTHRAESMHLLRYRLTTWKVPPTEPLLVTPLG